MPQVIRHKPPPVAERKPVRAAAQSSADATPTAERWAIWQQQLAAGREPCFGTPLRFLCDDTDCRLRARCLNLRAEWLR